MGFISSKIKYYKKSNASGELGHVNRKMKENKNAFPELTKNNFGFLYTDNPNSTSLEDVHKEKYNACNEQKREDKLRRLGKDANTFIDNVVIFDRDIFDDLIKNNKQEELKETMKGYCQGIKDRFGFEPVGFEFHLDEGTKNDETGKVEHNYHAHVVFFNHDFENRKTVLKNLRKKDFSEMQDITHEHFKKYGFERGISKEITNRKGLSKADYIKGLEKQVEHLKNEAIEFLQEHNEDLDYIQELQGKAEKYDNAKEFVVDFLNTWKNDSKIKKIFNAVSKNLPSTINSLKEYFNEFLDNFGIEKQAKPKLNSPELAAKVEQSNTFDVVEPAAVFVLKEEPKKEEPTKPKTKVFDSDEERKKQEEKLKAEAEQKKEEIKKIKNRRKNSKGTKKKP